MNKPMSKALSNPLYRIGLFCMGLGIAFITYVLPISGISASLVSGAALVQQGRDYYQTTHYAQAVDALEQAVNAFEREGLRLNQALALSYLALAQQHLGQRETAQTTIHTSRTLLLDTNETEAFRRVRAQVWNASGHLYLAWGLYEEAFESWHQAEADYHALDDSIGEIGSQINQAQAMQLLGLMAQADDLLEESSLTLQDQSLDPDIKALGLLQLGNTRRLIGDLDGSQEALEESLKVIQEFHLPNLQDEVQLDVGNTERASSERAIAIGKRSEALEHAQAAIDAYQKAEQDDRSSITSLQAQLNQLSLLIKMLEWAQSSPQIINDQYWSAIQDRANIQELIDSIQTNLIRASENRDAIYARLNFAHSLTRLLTLPSESSLPSSSPISSTSPTQLRAIANLLITATQQAQQLHDPKAESLALGQLGKLYELQHQWLAAQDLTEQALRLSERMQAAEIRYQWEWQLGRLLTAQGQRDDALLTYNAAVESLESVRSNLLFVDADIQFSFRDNVEPVYREFVELLLTHEDGVDPSQENLEKAIRKIDNLQLTELENFLSCNLYVEIDKVQVDPTAAIFYPILLKNRLIVILELPGDDQPLRFHELEIPRTEVEATLKSLRHDLSDAPDRTPFVIRQAREIYSWLIDPFEPLLEEFNQIETLVFVLDGALRNIPMAVLHDGNQYLISKYATAVAPRLELFTPRPLPQQLKLFTGGIGEPQTIEQRSFSKIEKLLEELNGIRQGINAEPPLQGSDFTKENLQKRLSSGDYSIIHLKTHGVFSSDPQETFIVAFQELIRSRDLGNLIQAGNRHGETPIELLVLSACSTATGDNRAVLGLAGVAVHAGVRSTLSTLWDAQDIPNTWLMIRFYEELSKPGMSKAQALRLAQLSLMNEAGYLAPHLWAPYIVVGNWL